MNHWPTARRRLQALALASLTASAAILSSVAIVALARAETVEVAQ